MWQGEGKSIDDEVVIDVEYEYEGDVEGEGESGAKGVTEDESIEDKECVANNDKTSDDYTDDESDFEENWDWSCVIP